MSKYYVIKSTDKETKGIVYFKRYLGNSFTSAENLANAKLFLDYETAKKHMKYIENDNPQKTFIDEIIEVEVDQFGNVVEIEGGKEMQKLYVVMAINQGKGSKGVFYLSDKEGLVLTENVENAYFFKNRTLAKEYVNEVEGNYPEYDLVVSVQEVRLSAEGIELDDVDESQKSEITLMVDGKELAKQIINGEPINGSISLENAIPVSKETELHQLITEDLLGIITQIAVLSVDEYPSSQYKIRESLKRIINAEVDLAWATANLLKK